MDNEEKLEYEKPLIVNKIEDSIGDEPIPPFRT
jgi:hypothetical protein